MGRVNVSLREDLVERLREMRSQGFVMSAIVERALREFLRTAPPLRKRIPVCLSLGDETETQLRAYVKDCGCSLSDVVERALERFFEQSDYRKFSVPTKRPYGFSRPQTFGPENEPASLK